METVGPLYVLPELGKFPSASLVSVVSFNQGTLLINVSIVLGAWGERNYVWFNAQAYGLNNWQ